MRKYLIKKLIRQYENVKEPKVRDQYGILCGAVGIVTNTFLCLVKIGLGLFFQSIAILADGINNLADASSSLILLIGIKLAKKPADSDHPYGHARMEYITGLLISFVIILVGIQLLKSSVEKILNPEPMWFHPILPIFLLLAIAIKIWLALFYSKIGALISSKAIKATGLDSRNDVITTSAVFVGLLVGHFSGVNLDGSLGFLVALFILYSGVRLIMETSSPLLGEAPDPEMIEGIQNRIRQNTDVLGIHDLVVHKYGPGRTFASVHIEVNAKEDIIKSHDMIDAIERAIAREMGIELVAHMDPVDLSDPIRSKVQAALLDIVKEMNGVLELHDLRVVAGYTHQKIVFDVVIGPDCTRKEKEIKKLLEDKIKELSDNFVPVITIDRIYSL